MNCISLLQPWASAMEIGVKTIETRSWRAPQKALGKPLAIAASANRKPDNSAVETWEWMRAQPDIMEALNAVGYYTFTDLPFGEVVCTVWLDRCVSTNDNPPSDVKAKPHDWRLGNFSENRFAWLTSSVVRLALPLPVKGQLGVYEWTAPAECERHSPFA